MKTGNFYDFDWGWIEVGPPPVPINSGDFLFLYNGGYGSHPDSQVGYAILNGTDPSIVITRSDQSILKSNQTWEQNPSRVFMTGKKFMTIF